ncbi:PHP domain-containing protein [Candidatus Woesearchaeota archaeon]|nr:PHP domain-containing protein [Candidatus Woesearchaeota archaeon]
MLKIDLHTHCNEDPVDRFIKHSPEELIDHAAKEGFNALSITCHNKVVFSRSLQKYANLKNILLIPGAERDIENKHVLLFNFTQEEIDNVKTFNDLREKKKLNQLAIAPHPFYVHPNSISLFSKLERNIDVFDAIEYSNLYFKGLNNLNKKADKIAQKYNLPMVGNSDLHRLDFIGSNFTLVDAEKNVLSVIKAIKDKKVVISSRPRSFLEAMRMFSYFATGLTKQKIFKIY